MSEFSGWLFDASFMPHVMCLRTPSVIWLHVVSDALIAIAYLLIPLGLLQIRGLLKSLKLNWLFILFSGFIVSCGATHILAIVTLWTPVYRFEGVLKAATALISLATAYLLVRMVPQIANLRVEQWRLANEQLEKKTAKASYDANLGLAIVFNSEDAIVSKTLDGVITSWNRGAERLLGYSEEEAIGRNVSMTVPRGYEEEELNILAAIQKGHATEHLETKRVHKDGTVLDVSLTISAVRDSTGRIVGASKIMRDVGVRKRAEQRFQMVVESAPNAIVMINRMGEITLVNTRTEQWFGYTREELMGKKIEMLLPERFRHAHGAHRTNFFAKPAVVGPSERAMGLDRELYARRKDGSEFPIEVGLNPIETEEGPMVLSAIVDTTGRKRMEENVREFNRNLEIQVGERTRELRNANRDLEDFAYAASHDLKAPLRVIDNCSKWIEEDLQEHLSGETMENMGLLRGRVQRMDRLLDDLLEYARIGRTKDTQGSHTIGGHQLMLDVMGMVAREGFDVKVGANLAGLQFWPMPLQQVLMNLIGNAMKHHDKKTGSIEVTVEDQGALYAFAVKDDGPGIAAQFHEQIFQMFQTLRPRDQVEGSGMGLAIVRKHVEAGGGTMQLESAEGEGSTFRFTLPNPTHHLAGIAK